MSLFSPDVLARLILNAKEVIDLLTKIALDEESDYSERADDLVTEIVVGKGAKDID